MSISGEDLVTQFKRKGLLDELRRSLYSEFKESDVNEHLTSVIQKIVDDEVNKDPRLLDRERGKAAVLIEGAMSRNSDKQRRTDEANAYKPVEQYIDRATKSSDKLREHVEAIIRRLVDEAGATKTANGNDTTERNGGA